MPQLRDRRASPATVGMRPGPPGQAVGMGLGVAVDMAAPVPGRVPLPSGADPHGAWKVPLLPCICPVSHHPDREGQYCSAYALLRRPGRPIGPPPGGPRRRSHMLSAAP